MDAAGFRLEAGRTRRVRAAARLVVLNEVRQKEARFSPDELAGLIEAVGKDRDRRAFAQLFAHFAPRVKSFLKRSGLADSIAEELTQDVMLALWSKASSFDPARAGASTWVFTIARNQRIDRLRRMRCEAADRLFDPGGEPRAPPSGEDIAIAMEREEEILGALRALSREQAAIVRLSFFAEKSHGEIARELDIPLGTVKSRVRLALNRLRSMLDTGL